MVFQPGQSGNPKGRAPGTRAPAKATKLSLREIANRGDVDTIDFLSAVVSGEKFGMPLRLQAAGLLAPYQHSRNTTRTIREPLDLPIATSAELATENIAKISALAAAGKIGLDEANDLVAHQRAFIESRVSMDVEAQMVELRELVARTAASHAAIDVTVSGGLPVPPGFEGVKMPVLGSPVNGDDRNGDDRENGS